MAMTHERLAVSSGLHTILTNYRVSGSPNVQNPQPTTSLLVFFVGLVKLWGDFFVRICGEALTGLGECDPESLQFLFSGSRVVPMLRSLYQCFASPVKIEECFLFGEAARGFPNFRSRWGLYTTWKPIAYPCDYVSSISHAFNARVLLCRVKSVSNLCFDLFIFQGIANLCFALSNQMPESQIMTNK